MRQARFRQGTGFLETRLFGNGRGLPAIGDGDGWLGARQAVQEPRPAEPGRAPDRIPADGTLVPLPPPAVEPLLTASERDVLRAIGAGLAVQELRDRSGRGWQTAQNATFSLLGRRYLSIGQPNADAARAWGPLLEKPTVE